MPLPLLVPALAAGAGALTGFVGADGAKSIATTAKWVAFGGVLFVTAKYLKVI